MFDLESNVRSWSDYLRGRGNLKKSDIIELENHLQDETDDLVKAGLSSEEAFLIGVKRLGNVTPNKVAALGENLVLLVNLGGLAWLYFLFFFKKTDFIKIEKWQTSYLYIYAIWLGIVAFIFPLIFGYD